MNSEIDTKIKQIKTITENGVQPSTILPIYESLKKLQENKGLTRHQLIVLIQDKTSPRLTRKQIDNTLTALESLEKSIIREYERQQKQG